MRYKRSVYQALAAVGQFGINMIVPIAMCSFVGILLDRWLGTSFIVIILFFIGALAGFRNIYLMAKRIGESEPGKDTGGHYGKKTPKR